MASFSDQLDRIVELGDQPPKRIVSLVPSQTELLADLGLKDRVVGVTKFCVHPKSWRKEKTIIGGTKSLRMETIRQLQPDLIIANQEENDRDQVLALAEEFPVWVSKVVDLDSALSMILAIGKMTETMPEAEQLVVDTKRGFRQLSQATLRSCLYLIWRNPYMAAGGDTFINHMLRCSGFLNVLASENRYPELTDDQILSLNPEVILLSSEPFPFKEKHTQELSILCPNADVRLVDGEMFSWYGSRLLLAASYFRNLRSDL